MLSSFTRQATSSLIPRAPYCVRNARPLRSSYVVKNMGVRDKETPSKAWPLLTKISLSWNSTVELLTSLKEKFRAVNATKQEY